VRIRPTPLAVGVFHGAFLLGLSARRGAGPAR
jgi:hypothetical protein